MATKRKILVSIDAGVLDRLDRVARQRGLTRSALISDLAARALGTRTPAEQKRVERAHARLVQLFARQPTTGDVVRLLREERERRA